MKKMNGLSVLVFAVAVTLAACGGGGGGDTPGTGTGTNTGTNTNTGTGTDPQVITSPTVSPIVSFMQSIASNDTGTFNEAFPGQANVWTLDADFALVDGFDLQFDFALALTVGSTIFDSDQTYGELTFYEPLMGAAEGVKVAAVSDGKTVLPSIETITAGVSTVITGTYAAFLNTTSNSRLQQTLDLTAVAAGTTITLDWRQAISLDAGIFFAPDPGYRVVIRQPDGTELKSLPGVHNATVLGPQNRSADLTQFAGQTIVLSFEVKSSTFPFSRTYAIIDSVSAYTGPTASKTQEFVTNGTFETGDMTGWTTNTPAEVQNIASGARTLEGLTVKRFFYTVPNKLWARWVDVYENSTASAISKTVTYDTDLGSDGAGVTYYSPGTGNKALTSWDYETLDRDIGLVFGNGTAVFSSEDGTGVNLNDIVTVTYDITVPPGGSVAIVNFIILGSTDTGLTSGLNATTKDPTAKATEIDAEAAKIVSNFWSETDTQYRTGMTQAQIAAISNFAKVQ